MSAGEGEIIQCAEGTIDFGPEPKGGKHVLLTAERLARYPFHLKEVCRMEGEDGAKYRLFCDSPPRGIVYVASSKAPGDLFAVSLSPVYRGCCEAVSALTDDNPRA